MKKTILYLFVMVAIAISSCSKESNTPFGVPSFEMSSSQLFLEQEVSFTNDSQFANFYRWDFGDGNTSDKKDPVHKYATPGEYKVILTIDDGSWVSKLVTVHDGDRAVYIVNDTPNELDITLFDRVSDSEIGKKRYAMGLVKGNAVSDTVYIKDDALGIGGLQEERSFLILDPLVFDLEKGKVNKLEIKSDAKMFFGIGLPAVK